jgi:hypothetical protein
MKYFLPSQGTLQSSVTVEKDLLFADFGSNNIPATKTESK